MTLIIVLALLGPLTLILSTVAGAAVAFPVVLAFHGVRGLFRHVIVPRWRRAFR